MTYVVDERCIKCKTTDCVDCGVCQPECPVDAIKPDTEPGLEKWLELNHEYALKWPNIAVKKDMPNDARAHWEETGKFEKYFSPKPGGGD
jgi:ferredoxin